MWYACFYMYIYIHIYIYGEVYVRFGCRVTLEAIFHGNSLSSVDTYALNPKPLAHSHVLDYNSLTLQPGDVVFHPL